MNWREDKTLIVLIGGIFFFTIVILTVTYTRSDDIQLYTLFAGVFGQLVGALMMYLKLDKAASAGSTTDTQIHKVEITPPVVEEKK